MAEGASHDERLMAGFVVALLAGDHECRTYLDRHFDEPLFAAFRLGDRAAVGLFKSELRRHVNAGLLTRLMGWWHKVLGRKSATQA